MNNIFIDKNIHFLKQGIDLLNLIDDALYTDAENPAYRSGIGKHMRHILDHYECFIEGISGRINYDARGRDERTEHDRHYAAEKAGTFIDQLQSAGDDQEFLNREVIVKSNEEGTEKISPWSRSTVKRELQFLISHTVHHFALIAFILRTKGIELPDEFGVAPSTLQYEKKKEAEEQS